MPDFLIANEPMVRLVTFAAMMALMAAWEWLAPRRKRTLGRLGRWTSNIGVVALDGLIVRLIFPTAVVGVALYAQEAGIGLFNQAALPGWAGFVLSVIALDLVIYWQHYAFHHISVLWRLHRMHHIDLDVDFTTGVRFHPVEILLSVLLKMAAVLALGAPAAAVILFEVILNGTAIFNHGNVRMPVWLDRALRALIVTPDMHRVHHSVIRAETDSNFGFSLSVWDRLFGTYRAQPAKGHGGMTIGQPDFRDPSDQRLDRLLINPFRSRARPR